MASYAGSFPPANIDEIEFGRYQLEIRTSAEYGSQSGQNLLFSDPIGSRTFDSNDRLAQQIGLVVNGAGAIADGSTFTLSDGTNWLIFEFDVTDTGENISAGTVAGNIPIAILAHDTTSDVAIKIRNAINSAVSQASLSVSASIQGQGTTDTTLTGSSTILLHGPAAITRTGSITVAGKENGLTVKSWGQDSDWGEDLGDSNRLRDQGLVVISSSSFSNSQSFGLRIDAGARAAGAPTFPGAAVNFPTNNADRLAPGMVVMNNIFARNVGGGIS